MFITLGQLSKKMLIPLLIPIVYTIRHILLKLTDDLEENSIFLNTFIVSLSYCLNIFPSIIEYKSIQSQKKENKETEFNNQLIIEKRKIELKNFKKRIIFIILISLYNFFNFQVYDLIKIYEPGNYKECYFYSISITVFFLSTALMSYLLLGSKIYNHQILALVASPILSLIMSSAFITTHKMEIAGVIYLFLCLLLRNFRFILMVFGKLYMEKYYISQFYLLSSFGIIGIFFSLISNLISYFIKFKDFEYKDEFNGKRLRNIFECFPNINKLYFFGSIFFWFIENNIIWYCISSLSPNHYIIYRNISSTIMIIVRIIKEDQKYIAIIIISIISLIGILICGLIFNEIIIIHICDLEKYTIIELDKRQKKEELEYNIIEDEDNRNITIESDKS